MRNTHLHDERLDVVARQLIASGARTVLDLGCGKGELLARLVGEPQFERLLGIDISTEALRQARLLLGLDPIPLGHGRVQVRNASFAVADTTLAGFDAAALVETIEHVDPHQLSAVERAVFGCCRPGTVIITTPNSEYNAVYGMRPGVFRHRDHRFEWDRPKFRRWADGVAARNAYTVSYDEIGELHRFRGRPTQMAVFCRNRSPDPPRP